MTKPKYKLGEKVLFKVLAGNKELAAEGQIYIVDACGTVESTSPSYDIMVEGIKEIWEGERTLIKHIKEADIIGLAK